MLASLFQEPYLVEGSKAMARENMVERWQQAAENLQQTTIGRGNQETKKQQELSKLVTWTKEQKEVQKSRDKQQNTTVIQMKEEPEGKEDFWQ